MCGRGVMAAAIDLGSNASAVGNRQKARSHRHFRKLATNPKGADGEKLPRNQGKKPEGEEKNLPKGYNLPRALADGESPPSEEARNKVKPWWRN